MIKQASAYRPIGFTMQCRHCDGPIYLYGGTGGRWRAYEPPGDAELDEWNRHRCAAALQDAEILSIVAPASTKPADLIPRISRLVHDFQGIIQQVESRTAELLP